MIPKIIHYCWFGRAKKPKAVMKCIASWQKLCPDYEIKEWNEDNFDVNCNRFISEAYKNKKYAFASDLARLIIVYQNGGFYFDTDVEIKKSLETLTNLNFFIGFESQKIVNSGQGFGAEKNSEIVGAMIKEYDNLSFSENSSCLAELACPAKNTEALKNFGLIEDGNTQSLSDKATVFSIEYFNPFDDATGKLNLTDNTYSIHWYSKTWMPKKVVLKSKITRIFHRLFGKDCFSKLRKKK